MQKISVKNSLEYQREMQGWQGRIIPAFSGSQPYYIFTAHSSIILVRILVLTELVTQKQ